MKQILKAELKVFRSGKIARVDISSKVLKKFIGKRVIVKVFKN